MLLASERDARRRGARALVPEARFGLAFLRKAWNPRTGVLALQVGIGSGNKAGTFSGDHDVWRLPAARRRAHRRRATATSRGVPPSAPTIRARRLPPNLAGRVSAAFALAAQIDASRQPGAGRAASSTLAAQHLRRRPHGQRQARRRRHGAPPRLLSRELVARRPGARRGRARARRPGARRSAHRPVAQGGKDWAREYLANEAGHDTLNLYDTSALAHADLVRALRTARSGSVLQAPAARRPARAARRAASRARSADPFARRGDLRRLRRRAAHLRPRRDGAALPRR